MKDRFDVIIIGSGIGGLVCGAKLAKEGQKVLILERHALPGGCVTSVRKKGYNFDYGAHLFGSCNKDGILRYYLRELGISDLEFIRLDPADRFVFPDMAIDVPQGIDEYMEKLKVFFPKEAGKIALFFEEAQSAARSFSSPKILSKYKGLSYESLLRRYFKDEKLMSVLSAQFRYMGSLPGDLAATSMCLMLVSYLRDGTYYPKGGTQEFPNSIAGRFARLGGTILYNNEVTRIIVKDGRARGVKTADGQVYESDTVVSNADAIRTFTLMVDAKAVDQKYISRLRALRVGSSFFMTFLGVKGPLNLRDKHSWHHRRYGLDLKPEESVYVFTPSLIDKSLAPKGGHVVELAMPFPYRYKEVKDWAACKKELTARLLNEAEKIMPGLKSSIDFEESATPKTIERYTYNAEGSMCGWEMAPDQVHDKRLPCETPIEGLYLAGHWTNPGCGVAPVATSGWIVANKILKNSTVASNV